ncbi:GNAT family N-acetyltransferase [Nocardioides insulae]|uniref:GNAT family N-acetyltransferase n=1 Tax=Nocardioides insulae TaxID=394734 RepID=UPI0004155D95|nr:GNAT family N-acetyltransferase [Nocardioides insulae]
MKPTEPTRLTRHTAAGDPGDLQLRAAGPADVVGIADLYSATRAAAVPSMPAALHTNAEDRSWFAARLADGEHEAWLVETGGRVAGFALFTRTWLDGLYVEPAAQRSGVGGMLLDLVKALRPDGFGLWVFESNLPARAFYARHGLVEVTRTDGSENEERAPDIHLEWRP